VLEGNTIVDVVPVNFWNPDRQIRQTSPRRLEWESITTGGTVGMVLTLADPAAGSLMLSTTQRNVGAEVNAVGGAPSAWECGGLEKRIQINRLRQDAPRALRRTVPVPLQEGENPLYVRITQEDGHMAWSSPIYVERPGA